MGFLSLGRAQGRSLCVPAPADKVSEKQVIQRGHLLSTAGAAEETAQDPSDDLPPDARSHTARRALRRCFHQTLVVATARTRMAEQDLAELVRDSAAALRRRRRVRRRSARARWRRLSLVCACGELLVRRLAVHALLVVTRQHRAADDGLSFGGCD